ncbi:MAG: serine protease [Planctomycetaceae bacterium]
MSQQAQDALGPIYSLVNDQNKVIATAFRLGNSRFLATVGHVFGAAHVFAEAGGQSQSCRSGQLKLRKDGERIDFALRQKMFDPDCGVDFAFIEVASDHELPTLRAPLGVSLSEDVFTIKSMRATVCGNDAALGARSIEVRVEGPTFPRVDEEKNAVIGLSCQVGLSNGCSGAPIVNDQGQVVGIFSYRFTPSSSDSRAGYFAMPLFRCFHLHPTLLRCTELLDSSCSANSMPFNSDKCQHLGKGFARNWTDEQVMQCNSMNLTCRSHKPAVALVAAITKASAGRQVSAPLLDQLLNMYKLIHTCGEDVSRKKYGARCRYHIDQIHRLAKRVCRSTLAVDAEAGLANGLMRALRLPKSLKPETTKLAETIERIAEFELAPRNGRRDSMPEDLGWWLGDFSDSFGHIVGCLSQEYRPSAPETRYLLEASEAHGVNHDEFSGLVYQLASIISPAE